MKFNYLSFTPVIRAGLFSILCLASVQSVSAAEAAKGQDYFTCNVAAQAGQPKQVEANKAVVKKYIDALGTARFDAVLKEVKAANYKELRDEFENLKYNLDADLTAASKPAVKAIPDRKNEVTCIIADGDLVAAAIKVTGTHKDNFMGVPATNKSFEFPGVSIFKLANGKISEAWLMADEAKLLRDIGARLPARKDGKLIAPPVHNDTREFDEVLAEYLAKPVDTAEFRHKVLLLSYKAKNKPQSYTDYLSKYTTAGGRVYAEYLRAGNQNTVDMLAKFKEEGKVISGAYGSAWGNRQDRIANVMAEGDVGMFQFRMTATNAGPLYVIPASNKPISAWEVGFNSFVGDKWQTAWYLGDELGEMLQIGSKEAQEFLLGDASSLPAIATPAPPAGGMGGAEGMGAGGPPAGGMAAGGMGAEGG